MNGRIDRIIHTYIMNRPPGGIYISRPNYTGSINAAWRVIRTFKAWDEIRITFDTVTLTRFSDGEEFIRHVDYPSEVPLQMCLAAMEALGIDEENSEFEQGK